MATDFAAIADTASNERPEDRAWLADKDHFIHPYTDFTTFQQEGSQVIREASGVTVTDTGGKAYLDAIAGLWCMNLGHGRTEIADAMGEQARKMAYFNTFGHSTNVPASLLAAEVAKRAPGSLNHVFYSTGGSTANDTAVRLIHYYFNRLGRHAKKKIISRNDGYHGSTYFASALTGIHGVHLGFDRISQDLVHHVSAANLYRRPAGMDEAQFCDYLVDELRQRIHQLGAENVAAFIAEPVMGAGGVLVAPAGYHRRVAQLCRENEILYIADEVVTGFGRLGHWFASEDRFGHVPDVIVSAKGISSGYCPLGATLFSDAIHEVIAVPQAPGGVLSHGFTYSGHPVSCAAALATIDIIERENILSHVREVGPYMQTRLKELLRHEVVGDVRGDHLMAGIELVKDRERRINFAPDSGATHKVFVAARQRGVIVRPVGNVIVLSPPLVISKAEIDIIVDTLHETMSEVGPALMAS
ncbi:aminotransferase [Novosphingobium taihuense]|uniref:Adenosylmethionine-8-amino-7-oxononanoate aminotransferase n=1 Tax=Novosphingobium taihuense TaxID=260085 RepID=A0A7W7ADD1_9SPHN|nr:aminotransferase [Novosphingobium taihuense]MBB4614175.1 adenosylmethionine-8-amino-7-oxononanoate aminotransferase [Novosphingobium taihuense]TWH87025.1 adenosylmethionine-8-amino-7-oxononanoate aminotransferase [Novosphingobium taihuense]